MVEEKKKHPISEMSTSRLHPIQEMNIALNKMENRQPVRSSFKMSPLEREGMMRVIETAQSFRPYRKKGP